LRDGTLGDVNIEEQRRIERQIREERERSGCIIAGIKVPAAVANEEAAPDDKDNCIVCTERKRCVICLPCAHLIMCITCTRKLAQDKGQATVCPVCREKVQEFKRVFSE
jgi:E3 ubiquitin-protein ligase MUL1